MTAYQHGEPGSAPAAEEMIELDVGVDVQGRTPKQGADQWTKDQPYIK